MILVPLFDLKFLERVCGNCCRNFKSAALAVLPRAQPMRAAATRFRLDLFLNTVAYGRPRLIRGSEGAGARHGFNAKRCRVAKRMAASGAGTIACARHAGATR